ncbi:hypothetical protein [Lysobacter capsici]|uniref:hypothetical protein n=1 Tax=Lysobacter capsici TaxID=435897 RepID=UPI001C008410|nr:hypothetical protein [Lysobacter capsici]QWF17348.1 hypothetical protein KME82_00635 [Lysobacter capsici]
MGDPTSPTNGHMPPPSGSPTPPAADVRLQPFGFQLPQSQWPDMSATGPWPLPSAPPTGPVPGFRIPPSQDPLSVLGPGLGPAGLTAPVTLPGRSEGSGIAWSGNTPLFGHFQRQTIAGPDGSVTSLGATLTDPRNGVVSGFAGASNGPTTLAIGGNPNGFVVAGSRTDGVDRLSLGVAGNLQTNTYTGFGSLQLGTSQLSALYSQSPTGSVASLDARHELGGGRVLSGGIRHDSGTDTTGLNAAFNGGPGGFNLSTAVTRSPQGTGVEASASQAFGTDNWLRVGASAAFNPGGAYRFGPTLDTTLAPNLTASGRLNFERDQGGRQTFGGQAEINYREPSSGVSFFGRVATDGRGTSGVFGLTIPLGGGGGGSTRGLPSGGAEFRLPDPAPNRDAPDRRSALEPRTPVEGRAPTGPRTASAGGDANALLDGLIAGDRNALDAARNLPAGQDMRRQAVATVDRQEQQQAAQAPETQQAVQPDAPSRGARSIG